MPSEPRLRPTSGAIPRKRTSQPRGAAGTAPPQEPACCLGATAPSSGPRRPGSWRRAWRTRLAGRVAVSTAPSRHRHGRRQRGAGLQGRAGRPPPLPGGGLCWGQDVRRQKLGGFRETLGHTPPGGRAKPSLPHCTCAGPVTCGHEFSFAVYTFSSRVWVRTPGFAKDRLTLKEADTRNLKGGNFFCGSRIVSGV